MNEKNLKFQEELPKAFVFTKVGIHKIKKGVDELLENILARKLFELYSAGEIWWGYNNKIRPEVFESFRKIVYEEGYPDIHILMALTKAEKKYRRVKNIISLKLSDIPPCEPAENIKKNGAKFYSVNKNDPYINIDKNAYVTKSNRAFVFKDFRDSNLTIDLGKYKAFSDVGKDSPNFSGTIQDFDKGVYGYQYDTVCGLYNPKLGDSGEYKRIHYIGKLIHPYCVYLK